MSLTRCHFSIPPHSISIFRSYPDKSLKPNMWLLQSFLNPTPESGHYPDRLTNCPGSHQQKGHIWGKRVKPHEGSIHKLQSNVKPCSDIDSIQKGFSCHQPNYARYVRKNSNHRSDTGNIGNVVTHAFQIPVGLNMKESQPSLGPFEKRGSEFWGVVVGSVEKPGTTCWNSITSYPNTNDTL